jgi:2-polyprenyl-6-methoxyphenol hydroxylase-like FAD-dependent oxidoreductase
MDGETCPVMEPLCFGRPRIGAVAAGVAEVVIVGGGIAGSLLALALGRRGHRVAVVDLHETYPADFRCEKLNAEQVSLLAGLKVLDCYGDDAASLHERGLRYADMVAAPRAAWPRSVRLITGRAVEIVNGDDVQTVVLADGRRIQGRLAVLATGPSDKLRASLGVARKMVRERHSVCIGFTLAPAEGSEFDFPAMIHHGEAAGDGMAFASFFPLDGAMRVNLFAHRGPREAWTLGFRDDPLARLFEAMPGLEPFLAGARVLDRAEIRATDLYETENHVLDGVVLVGDASRSCCPVTGMGVTRILVELKLLADVYLPSWLATPGMGADKTAGFYDDPAKRRIDAQAARRAETARAVSTRTSLPWRARRNLAQLKRAALALTQRAPSHHA